jgi:hypothetical protein
MVKIFNDSDQMCMARSIAVGISFATNDPHWNEMRKPRGLQMETAKQYCQLSNVSVDEPCGISHAKRFEKALKVQIKIVAGDLMEDLIYRGSSKLNHPAVFIYR